MKTTNIESKYEGENIDEPKISRQEKFFRLIFTSNILLAATRSNYVPTEAEALEVDDRFPQGEVYISPEEDTINPVGDKGPMLDEAYEDGLFFPDFLTSPSEFCFLSSTVGSGLDSEGFIVGKEIEIMVEDTDEEVVEEDVFAKLEANLSPEVKEILSMQPELSFDENGKLYYEEGEDTNPVLTVETDRHLLFPYEQLNDVKFFVIHYDGAPQTFVSGEYRTVLNTINGLNREGNPSVQFCVDSYPVNDEFVDNNGVGIIHSQATGPMPYKGRHVVIGYDLETGREDLYRVKTADLYEQMGVGQDYVDFIRAGNKDFDSFSLGLEQVGSNYSYNFPEQFPPNQQIANVLALVEAASERYGLSAWDIVGHREIQEKSDPGEEYMLTLRYLLGLSYLLDEQLPDDFLETDDPYDYFIKLRDYSIARMGEDRYSTWDDIYGLDGVIEWFENEEVRVTEEKSTERIISEEEKQFLANNEIYSGDRERDIVIMTYDDGGREEDIQHIMEVYEKYGVKTTFFVTGQWVERNRELTKEIIERGFEVGCHGWNHAEMSSLSGAEATRQIADFLDLMKEIDEEYEVRLIRFPFGSRTQALREIAAEYGLQSVMWSNESGGVDEGTYDNVMRGLQAGDIVLSHSTRWYDVHEVERILGGLLEKGYDVVTVGEGMAKGNVYSP